MDTSSNGSFSTSGTFNEDIIIYHTCDYNVPYFIYDTGKFFVDICLDMGLDLDNNTTIKLF